ncbi:hypothetical protein OBBRIDRAFT_358687 [Obba rivulosa]|uniref:Uncharacterized protein n=1 Tax=Obba rivulosa TaxID=1052685 RepID=A0A8E2DUQ9_9APHY|nr:hypothetical protein OBBRIDRAFT_358687 [Obba rivulosa]
MAVPQDMTILDISGKYMMNKSLSDDTDEILRLQGVSWFKRKAIRMASIYLTVKHYTSDDGVEHIDIDQVLSGGVGSNTENRILDYEEREINDPTFGWVLSRSRRVSLDDIDNDWLREGWMDDVWEHGTVDTRAQSATEKSHTTWAVEQTWGFEEIDGEKRYARHLDFLGPGGEKIRARLVYDYQGTL